MLPENGFAQKVTIYKPFLLKSGSFLGFLSPDLCDCKQVSCRRPAFPLQGLSGLRHVGLQEPSRCHSISYPKSFLIASLSFIVFEA
jgi:hypothetical protein